MLDASLDDAFRRLAAENQLSHCKQTKRKTHNDSQHTVTASRPNTLKLQNSDNLSSTGACQLRRAELISSIAHCSLLEFEWRRWRRRRLLARPLDNALGCERLEPQPLGLEVGLLAGSGDLGDVDLRTHGHRGETAAALALEVVDDKGVTRNRRRTAREWRRRRATTASVWPAWTRCGERRC